MSAVTQFVSLATSSSYDSLLEPYKKEGPYSHCSDWRIFASLLNEFDAYKEAVANVKDTSLDYERNKNAVIDLIGIKKSSVIGKKIGFYFSATGDSFRNLFNYNNEKDESRNERHYVLILKRLRDKGIDVLHLKNEKGKKIGIEEFLENYKNFFGLVAPSQYVSFYIRDIHSLAEIIALYFEKESYLEVYYILKECFDSSNVNQNGLNEEKCGSDLKETADVQADCLKFFNPKSFEKTLYGSDGNGGLCHFISANRKQFEIKRYKAVFNAVTESINKQSGEDLFADIHQRIDESAKQIKSSKKKNLELIEEINGKKTKQSDEILDVSNQITVGEQTKIFVKAMTLLCNRKEDNDDFTKAYKRIFERTSYQKNEINLKKGHSSKRTEMIGFIRSLFILYSVSDFERKGGITCKEDVEEFKIKINRDLQNIGLHQLWMPDDNNNYFYYYRYYVFDLYFTETLNRLIKNYEKQH